MTLKEIAKFKEKVKDKVNRGISQAVYSNQKLLEVINRIPLPKPPMGLVKSRWCPKCCVYMKFMVGVRTVRTNILENDSRVFGSFRLCPHCGTILQKNSMGEKVPEK